MERGFSHHHIVCKSEIFKKMIPKILKVGVTTRHYQSKRKGL